MADKKKQVLKTRPVSGGAQQWTRGKDAGDRADTALEAVRSARRDWQRTDPLKRERVMEARRRLLRAMDDEIKPITVRINKRKMEKVGSTLQSLRPKPKSK